MRGIRYQVSGIRFRIAGDWLAQSLATAVPRAAWGHDLHNLQDGGLRGRRGITLLEVLISIFVIAIGLLGVAAMIPIGTLAVSETAKADRSAALGRAAMHEVRVRDMLERMRDEGNDIGRWYLAEYGLELCNDNSFAAVDIRRQFLIGQPFAIDPLFATEAAANPGTTGHFDCFPFKTSSNFAYYDPNLTRLRLDIFEGALGMGNYRTFTVAQKQTFSQQQLLVFDRIFIWQDDLLFDLDEDDPDRRPRQSCIWSDGSVAPFPEASATATPLRSQSEDNYSWMLTAVPDPNELPNTYDINDLTAHRQKNYTVSVVTFYKRDFICDANVEPPSERFIEIQFVGTGIGGGDAMLRIPTSSVSSQELAEEYLKVKDNEWIMVTGFVREPRLDPIAATYLPPGQFIHRRIAKWYRVIRVDDEIVEPAPGTYTRQITLAGPDWNNSEIASDTTANATIIDGAIGVYTTTVTLP